jgi:molybdenum cofactor biosynthesis protein B
MSSSESQFVQMNVAVLTVSDTRDETNDSSGAYLCDQLGALGHVVYTRQIVIDDVYLMRAAVAQWIADPVVHCIVSTGGTGFTGRDSTPEALRPLFDKHIEGFGELFRYLSLSDIGTSTVQSRAFAGIANQTVIFCLPGSTGACKTAWEGILLEQLDARHKPCNFVSHTNAKQAMLNKHR